MTERIRELEGDRRRVLRQRDRARQRRNKALRERRWAAARSALVVKRRKDREAQELLKRIRALRKERSKKNAVARALRHRRSAGRSENGLQLWWFDGRKVTTEAYERLKFARAHGWTGYLTSGHREPSYSRGLCYAMCGAPSCSGRCAGVASNHVRNAIDVTKPWEFDRAMKHPNAPRPRWFNALGWRDPVHFSPNGR